MHPVKFEGSIEIKKPENMTDEQCYSVWAKSGFGTLQRLTDTFDSSGGRALMHVVAGTDIENFPYYITAWQPNKEDIEAINRGEPIFVKTISKALPPMALFTIDENKNGNF